MCNSVNILETASLYTLKSWILRAIAHEAFIFKNSEKIIALITTMKIYDIETRTMTHINNCLFISLL